MQLDKKQIKETKMVGKLNGQPVVLMTTFGGYSLIASPQKGAIKYLGAGSLPAISKHVASINEPGIEWELSKSEEDNIDVRAFAHVIPEMVSLTKRLQELSDNAD
jgi:hypothetical protein